MINAINRLVNSMVSMHQVFEQSGQRMLSGNTQEQYIQAYILFVLCKEPLMLLRLTEQVGLSPSCTVYPYVCVILPQVDKEHTPDGAAQCPLY